MFLQIPTEVPHPDTNTAIDFNNTFDVVVYIVAPVILIVLYFYLRKKSRNSQNDENSESKED